MSSFYIVTILYKPETGQVMKWWYLKRKTDCGETSSIFWDGVWCSVSVTTKLLTWQNMFHKYPDEVRKFRLAISRNWRWPSNWIRKSLQRSPQGRWLKAWSDHSNALVNENDRKVNTRFISGKFNDDRAKISRAAHCPLKIDCTATNRHSLH